MPIEIGERVVFRSLQWEVADNAAEHYVELFGRSAGNRGRTVRALVGLEPIERALPPPLTWTLGAPGWNPLEWKALHDAYRLTTTQGYGDLGPVDWGRLILEPYQLAPLRRIEQLPFPRLLLADDTGLGKTAEAGMILFRLMQRRRAERVLILTRARPEPERWQAELREKFGIECAVINDGNDYARLRRTVPSHLNVFGYIPRLIMSMHFAAQPHVVDNLRRDLRWDAAILDEAHHLADSSDDRKQLAELGRVVASRCEALLLLTATPHNGKGESFASLLRLLDPYAVVDPDRLDRTIVRPLVVRRLKPQVVKADGSRFLRRELHVLDVDQLRSRAERSLDKGLRDYAALLRARARELEAAGERSLAMGATFLETFLRKRLASSAHACTISLRNRLRKVSGAALPDEGEDVAEDRTERDLYVAPLTLADGRTEAAVLHDLLARAEKIALGDEAKVKALLELLHHLGEQKVIVFTEFRDTLHLLEQMLDGAGYGGRYLTYHGDTPPQTRSEIRRRFAGDPQARILLATDAASEGINLQQSCNVLVHMEIPWNPNRYEQRNGRIDRYGQRARPQVYLLVATKSLEDRVAQVVLEKLEKIAEQVGSVSNVFPVAAKISVDDYLEEVDADAAAAKAGAAFDRAGQALAAELADEIGDDLILGDAFDAAMVTAMQHELAQARAFAPDYTDVKHFLEHFFRSEQGLVEPTGTPDIFRIVVPKSLRGEVGAEGYPQATFRRDIAIADAEQGGATRVEFLLPGHPLVRAALRRMRGRVYAPGFASRLSYRKAPADATPGYIFTYVMRFIDGRGEMLEERFEPVFVALDGAVSDDPTADLARLVTSDANVTNPNLTAAEEHELLPRFQAGFAAAQEAALTEARRRQQVRRAELSSHQERVADDALMRLGRWTAASEQRVQQRFDDLRGGVQLDIFGAVSRRLQHFRREQEELLAQQEARRTEIRAMRQVRGEEIDAIGALVLVAEMGQHA